MRRPGQIDAELHNRDVGLGKEATKDRPGAMVKPPLPVEFNGIRDNASRIITASAGSPGAGYVIVYSSEGKPPKSWMVRGWGMAVTIVPGRYQWAETASIAAGRGSSAPSKAQPSVHRLFRMTFIGVPWPMKTAGMELCEHEPYASPVLLICLTTHRRR